jgi:hypothetical protein
MRNNNSLVNVLTPKTQAPDKYTRSRAYKLTCPDCHKAYVGQTVRSFTQRFKEHKDAFTFSRNNSNYAYAKHALTHSHSIGPIHTTMQILQYQNKGAHLNTIQSVSKPMSQTFPGYSPPPLKQKSSYQHGSKSEQVPRYPRLCRTPRNAVINKKRPTMSNA